MTNNDQQESDFPNIGKPAQRALHHAGYWRLEQLTTVTESEIMQLHGVGPKAINRLRDAMQEIGLSFADGG